jgi:hypothetical protein
VLYVVERYLPGVEQADLVRALERLDQTTRELSREGSPVRYLGSTIVAADEACFCRFEGSEPAVREANRRAGVPFDRVTAGIAVSPTKGKQP